jgi:hypothetical protein
LELKSAGKPQEKKNVQQQFTAFLRHPNAENAVFLVMLLVFSACLVYFAFHTHKALVPDEPGYIYISTLFAQTWKVPSPTEYSLALGFSRFERSPFLYFWINGRVLNFLTWIAPDINEWRQIIGLRMVNATYSILSILFTYLLAREVNKKRWWSLLPVFLMTSTLMYAFLSGGVSYDNLANLGAVAGIYFLVRLLRGKPFIPNSLMWIFFIAVGALAKKTILPLALVMFIIWLVYIIKQRKTLNLKAEISPRLIPLAIPTLLIVALSFVVYGVNLVKYLEPIPDCRDLMTDAQCSLSVYERRADEMGFPETRLTLRDVIQQQKTNPINYFDEYWINRMLKTAYGIMGHQAYYPTLIVTFYRLFYLFIFIIAIKYWLKSDFTFISLMVIVLSYIVVIFFESYNEELMSDFQHVAIQGRYQFPILAAFYVMVTEFISRISAGWLRKLTLAYTFILFSIGGPVLFLLYFAGAKGLNWFY